MRQQTERVSLGNPSEIKKRRRGVNGKFKLQKMYSLLFSCLVLLALSYYWPDNARKEKHVRTIQDDENLDLCLTADTRPPSSHLFFLFFFNCKIIKIPLFPYLLFIDCVEVKRSSVHPSTISAAPPPPSAVAQGVGGEEHEMQIANCFWWKKF